VSEQHCGILVWQVIATTSTFPLSSALLQLWLRELHMCFEEVTYHHSSDLLQHRPEGSFRVILPKDTRGAKKIGNTINQNLELL
jgi:hypothetical protein